MPSPVIVRADRPDRLPAVADDHVDEGGLSDSGRSEQRTGAGRAHDLAQRWNAFSADGARDHDGNAWRDVLNVRQPAVTLSLQVRLVEHDDRTRTALPRKREIPFRSPRAEVAI